MKQFREIFICVFAIIVVAKTAFFSTSTRAQEATAEQVLTGEFSLPQEVHWGNSVLPTGDFVYFVDSSRRPVVVRVQQKDGDFAGVFVAESILRPGSGGQVGVVLATSGSETFVKALRLDQAGGELNFSTPDADGAHPDEDRDSGRSTPSKVEALEFLTVFNPEHEKMSLEEANKVYLRACEAVEKEFNRTSPVRPRVILRLGASGNVLRYPMREIHLKKWDEYRFADAVVELAIHDMVSHDVRAKLRNAAVTEAGATVDLCELKSCVN